MRMTKYLGCVLVLCLGMASAQATLITNGFTYTVASGGGAPSTGTHYHSNTGGAFGNPAGKAEVGGFSTEETRGLSEYNITGQSAAATAFVTFDVFKMGGLFTNVNDTPFSGDIDVWAYQGNNLEDIADYQAATVGAKVATFSTSGLSVGDITSFDITSAFNNAVGNSWTSLGIRLQPAPWPGSHAVTFQDFRLTTDNQSTNIVPEPISMVAVCMGLVGLGGYIRKRRLA